MEQSSMKQPWLIWVNKHESTRAGDTRTKNKTQHNSAQNFDILHQPGPPFLTNINWGYGMDK